MAKMRDDGERGGEGYFASVSDLMVGMLFVFLLMLTVFALNYRTAADSAQAAQAQAEDDRAEAKAARAAAEEARREAEAARAEAEAARAEADLLAADNRQLRVELLAALREEIDQVERDLHRRTVARDRMLDELKQRLEDRNVVVRVDTSSGVLRLEETTLRFATGRADLSEEGRATVRTVASVFREVLPCFAETAGEADSAYCPVAPEPILEAVFVEGHTDRRPITVATRFLDNYQLSAERALTVYRDMLGNRPELAELRNTAGEALLAVSGYGEDRPLPEALGDDDRSWAMNRRIDVRFVLSSPTPPELDALRQRVEQALARQP